MLSASHINTIFPPSQLCTCWG